MKILLADIMYRKNLSVRQVSYLTGIPRSTISDIMNGRKVPRLDTLERLAEGLNVRMTDLFDSKFK